jgi:Ca2+-binding EF-hand superfamily protein
MTRIATTGSNVSDRDKDSAPKPRRMPEEEALSTKEDAWDLLLIDESGQRQRTLTVEALADIFDELRTSGLDASIAPHLRVRPEGDETTPSEARSPKASGPTGQIVTGRHVKYLCMMLIKDQLYEEYPTDLEEIANFQFQLQMDVDLGKDIDNNVRINFKNFKKIVDFVAKMQCLDEALIVMQIVWIKTGRFEINPELHTAIAAIAKWKDAAFEFKRNQLDILVHSSGILHKCSKSELNWGNFHQQFDKFLLQKLDLLKERQDRKNAPKPQESHEFFAKGYHSNDSVCGRTEFGLWLETVFAFANKTQRVYPSPLAMCIEWIRTSRLLEEESSSSDPDDDEVAARAKLKTEQDLVFREMKKKAKETETMKDRFKRLDLNSNGSLDFSEFCAFLLSGTPHLSGKELRGLFKSADVNGDGIVVFEEFVDFIHGSEERLHEEQPTAPEGVRLAFKAYCSSNNEQIDASHFSKILKDAKLVDDAFTLADVDIIFNQMRNPKEKTIALPQFERALKHCADKKGVELGEVYEAIWAVPIEIAPQDSLDTKTSKDQSKTGGFLALGWLKGNKSAKQSKSPNVSPRQVTTAEGRSDGSPTSPGMKLSKSMAHLGIGAKRASKKVSARES